MRIRARSTSAVVLALALTAAACGGDDDASPASSAPASTPGTDAPTTEPPAATTEPTEPATEGPAGEGTMSPEMAAAVDAAAAAFLASPDAQGATAFYVGISDPDNGDYLAAYGDAGVDGPAATVADSFRIGSITKSVTATIVLQLVEEGEISLDDTVTDLLPDRAVDYPDLADLTVRQLLGMTSGIADYLNVPDSVVVDITADPQRVWGAEELIAAGIDGGVQPAGTPGYSTTNYIVLQLIVESLTGTSIQDLIAERIAGPLELEHFVLPPNDDTTLPEPLSRGYINGGCVEEFAKDGATVEAGTDVTDWNASYGQAGGGMTSDIADLLAWAQNGTGNAVLEAGTAEERNLLTDIGGIAYGLGIMRVGAWYGHEGEAIGWEAFSLFDPETGVSVAIAANGCGGVIAGFAAFLDAVYPDGGVFDALFYGPDPSILAPTDEPSTSEPTTSEPTDEPEVPAGGASGTATFTAGDVSFDGEVVACLLDGNDVTMNVNGENSGIEVLPLGGGQTSVEVSGMLTWVGVGDATVDKGSVSIVGTGSLDEPGAAIEDFTLTAEIGSC